MNSFSDSNFGKCEPSRLACNSVNGYITNDYKNKISYLSTRLAVDKNVSVLLKQAAIRSLSCEVVPGKEGTYREWDDIPCKIVQHVLCQFTQKPHHLVLWITSSSECDLTSNVLLTGQIYFGDSVRGHVLSHTFFLKDTQARGFQRWYSVVVFMRDKHFLLNSWSFFLKHIKQMVYHLQEMASQVYTNEQNKRSQRALRYLSFLDQVNPDTRSLVNLTASATVFAKIHLWFSWLLSLGARRLEEQLPTRELDCYVEEKQECEGFIVVEDAKRRKSHHIDPNLEEVVTEVRKMRRVLGALKFQTLLYSTLVGHQIVIRGPKEMVRHVIILLRFFMPKKKFRCLEYADSYQTPDVCNVLGLTLYAAAPKPTHTISRLDIIPSGKAGAAAGGIGGISSTDDLDDHELLLKTAFDLPGKWPTLLTKIDKALSDSTLSDKVVYLHIISLMEEWINLTETIAIVKTKRRNADMTGLLQCLGVQDQDDRLVQFWTSSSNV